MLVYFCMKCERAYVPSELTHVFGEHYRCNDRAKCATVRLESLQRRGHQIPPELLREANGYTPKVRGDFFESLQQMPEPLAAPAYQQAKPAKKPERSPWNKKPVEAEEDAVAMGEVVSADLLRSVDEMFGEIFEDQPKAASAETEEPVQVAAKAFVDDEVTSETQAYREEPKPAKPVPVAAPVKLKVAAKPKAETKAKAQPKPAKKPAESKKPGPKGEVMLPQGKREIVGRIDKSGKTYRQLSCGHEQKEPTGGKAHLAKSAFCQICIQAEKAA